ncbi:MAG: tetratricopeptide repeat protein [Thermodesulfobacteriota bacterium]
MTPASPPGALSYAALDRFQEILKPPFRRALNSGRVDLLPLPDLGDQRQLPLQEALARGSALFDTTGGRLIIPLIHKGRPLALLSAHGVSAEQLPAPVHPFLASLVEAALDLVRLRLAAETDPLTGLANEQALDEALTTAISRLAPSRRRGRLALDAEGDGQGLCLLAFEPQGLAAWQERHGRRPAEALRRGLAGLALTAAPEALLAARAGEVYFLLLPGRAEAAQQAAAALSIGAAELEPEEAVGQPWSGRLSLGAASLSARSDGPAAEAAALFKARALRAQQAAARAGLEELLWFDHIPDQAGRLLEVMPLDRVLINLGRVHGLSEGERFGVSAAGDESGQTKAEVVLVILGEEESLAEVVQLSQPTVLLRPGDVLRRLAPQAQVQANGGRQRTLSLGGVELPVVLEEVTGLLEHRSLARAFQALAASGQGFAAALMRVEGLEAMAEVSGRLGAEALMSGLATAVREAFGAQAVLGRHSPEALAVLLPGQNAGQARDSALQAVARLQERGGRPVRVGVAAHPCPGFSAEQTLDNAGKALVHAGFLEPYSVVIFDAVSLNVSGDDLFNQGRLSEAVAEYEKALGLEPNEANVLNSLGVCHGQLGQMERAREYFERAQAAAPQDYMAHYNLGLALMGLGRAAEAEACLQRSLELSPEHADALYQLGRLAQSQGRSKEALDYFQRAAVQPGCKKAVHRRLGEVLAAEGQPAKAEEAFKEAVKANPADAASLCGLAVLYLDRRANLEIALSLARRAHQREPLALRYIRVLARSLLALGRLPEALWLLRDAAEEHPQEPHLALLLGQAEEGLSHPEEARQHYGRALSLEPNLEEARAGLARLEAQA